MTDPVPPSQTGPAAAPPTPAGRSVMPPLPSMAPGSVLEVQVAPGLDSHHLDVPDVPDVPAAPDAPDVPRVVRVPLAGARPRDLPERLARARAVRAPAPGTWWVLEAVAGLDARWRAAIDAQREPGRPLAGARIVVTGWAVPGPPGPWPVRIARPLGFRSFVHASQQPVPPEQPARIATSALSPAVLRRATSMLAPWQETLEAAWHDYLVVGGLHGGATGPPVSFEQLHDAVFRRAEWSLTQTRLLLAALADGLGEPTNHRALAEQLGTSPQTVGRRLEELAAAGVTLPVPREQDLAPLPAAQAQVRFTDPAYLPTADALATGHAAGAAQPTALPTDRQLARRGGQQLAMALLRGIEAEQDHRPAGPGALLHHRTATRRRIDLVGPELGGTAIMLLDTDRSWRRAAQTLRASPWRGVVATRRVLEVSDREVLAVPTCLLAWLVDT